MPKLPLTDRNLGREKQRKRAESKRSFFEIVERKVGLEPDIPGLEDRNIDLYTTSAS